MKIEAVSVSFTKKYWVSVLPTYQILVNPLFVKYLYKTVKVILLLFKSPSQDAVEFQNFCQILKQF